MSTSTPPLSEPILVTVPKARHWTRWLTAAGIVAINAGALWAFIRGGITWQLVLICAISFYVRMFGITAVYHRYFSHRAYRTSRAFQLVLAVIGASATQKGPLWWAATHRHHHRYSDAENDVHSPMRRGFWYSHMGWWLGREHEEYDEKNIQDFAGYPELRWLDRWHVLPSLVIMAVAYAIGGVELLLWAYVVPTCLLAHATFTINSLAHVWGSRRFATTDTSRNNFFLALLTMGEGWHNNHHHYQSAARNGFMWWEIDLSFYILKALEKVGLVWDLRPVPAHVMKRNLLAEVGEKAPLLLARQGKPVPVTPIAEPALMDAE